MPDKNTFLSEIGQRITERRLEMRLTQEEFAEKADLSPQFVSYAEAGKRAMRPENLLKLSTGLEVSADYLLTGEYVDKDNLRLSEKIEKLTPEEARIVETLIDELLRTYHHD